MLERLLGFLNEMVPDTALATDEHGETIDLSEDPFVPQILERGECFNLMEPGSQQEAFLADLERGDCHANCANIIKQGVEPEDRLFTGFALADNGEWFTHTFIINGGSVVEPGSELFLCYVGVELTGDDKANFVDYWGAKNVH